MGVEEKDKRGALKNHMLPQKTGTQDPGMQENNDRRELLSLRRERWGQKRGRQQSLCGRCSVPFSTTCESCLSLHPHTCQVPGQCKVTVVSSNLAGLTACCTS